MASPTTSISHPKKMTLFLNTSFLFLLLFYLVIANYLEEFNQPEIITSKSLVIQGLNRSDNGCTGLHELTDYKSKCAYVKSHIGCRPKGCLNYLQIFYCTCGQFPILGHLVLLLWLLVLFYLLGNTASNYFCSSLESLSNLLKLSPTIAGATLLSLGNGAPDVFSSIVSFTGSNNGDVGLNSVLGGAFFVSSAVVGVLSTVVSSREISVDQSSFIRDVCFFLFSLCSLLLIILIGKITLLGAISFLSIYFFYVCVVCIMQFFHCRKQKKVKPLPVSGTSKDFHMDSQEENVDMGIPLLGYADDEKPILLDKTTLDQDHQHQDPTFFNLDSSLCCFLGKLLYVLDLPLYLPRRLTIPVVSEEKWSKPIAVTSVTLAPLLIAALWDTLREKKLGSRGSLVTYMTAGLVGLFLGNLAFATTEKSNPPKKCLFPWLAGGFLMSIVWTYIIAEELVSLLVSLGHIIGIDPSVLGLTVLAWGNSLGDLIANVAMAMNGGSDGAQIAISGCYAGPMFNTLLGLGISFAISSWCTHPSSYVIPDDPSLYETLGFMIGGLLWALVILPRKNMRLDKFLGIGLLGIYSCFLSLRVARALGVLKLHGFSFFRN